MPREIKETFYECTVCGTKYVSLEGAMTCEGEHYCAHENIQYAIYEGILEAQCSSCLTIVDYVDIDVLICCASYCGRDKELFEIIKKFYGDTRKCMTAESDSSLELEQ